MRLVHQGEPPGSRKVGEANMTDLWCIHVEGPDDIIAMPTKETAERDAEIINEGWRNRRDPSRDDPAFRAVAKPWPYSAEQHAEDIKRSIEMETRH